MIDIFVWERTIYGVSYVSLKHGASHIAGLVVNYGISNTTVLEIP